MTQSFSFAVGPGQVREVHDDSVEAFDNALAGVGTAGVNHFIDPRRIQSFEAGGPPVWSVATVTTKAGTLYLTYGFSEALDPGRVGVNFEMSILVAGEATMWPALLLRALCRYMLGSKRPLETGQAMPFPAAITRFFAPPHEQANYPATEMTAVLFTADPLLPSIDTGRGVVEVRRAVGLYEDERALFDLWTPRGFLECFAQRDASLATAIERASLTADSSFVSAIEAGSRRDGSQISFVAVPGVQWEQDENGALLVEFPGGEHARRVLQMVRARLPFGNHLLVHDLDPEKTDAVAFEPGEGKIGFRNEGSTLIISIPAGHDLFESFAEAGDGPNVKWKFG
ncbi:MAG: suppressor of fused domain protein [Nannocystaceae bacterium]|nr:suppressor of fused domain protein [Nannocystaceae bacterium]